MNAQTQEIHQPAVSRLRPGCGGFTITEMVFFGGIAVVVIILMIGLLSRGSRIFELGRLTSSAQNDVRILLEHLAEDAAELVYLDKDKPPNGSPSVMFYVTSSRTESGLAGSSARSLRRIEYRLDGTGDLKSCKRKVTLLDDSKAEKGSVDRTLIERNIRSLRFWALVATPNGGGTVKPYYKVALAADAAGPSTAEARAKGATVACLVVDLEAGESRGKKDMDQQAVTKIVTRLWCRNRVLELARGSLR